MLKKYLADLFGFNLFLESKGEYKLASIEAMFLPYYVSQDYGWVLALKSFRGFEFYKHFKADYYDYYLGITNEYDREEKQRLEKEKKNFESEIKFLTNTEQGKDELQLAKLKDESFVNKSAEYINIYKEDKNKLIQKEKNYIIISNEIKFLEERKNILNKIRRATNEQKPLNSDCPTCQQNLPSSIEKVYEYIQNQDDTNNELILIKKKLKEKTGVLNSEIKNIEDLRKVISSKYSILNDYIIEDLTVNSWLNNKSNVLLSNNILKQIGEVTLKLEKTISDLKPFKSDADLIKERQNKDYEFLTLFKSYLKELNVKDFKEDYSLYRMKLFPQQGVELLKTLLAYYFAFNTVIKKTNYVHRFPFVMDAIFKEDVDADNKVLILKFISNNIPKDTQVIFSIAESKKNNVSAEVYNKNLLNSKAKLILINKEEERAFLSDYKSEYDPIRNETLEITNA